MGNVGKKFGKKLPCYPLMGSKGKRGKKVKTSQILKPPHVCVRAMGWHLAGRVGNRVASLSWESTESEVCLVCSVVYTIGSLSSIRPRVFGCVFVSVLVRVGWAVLGGACRVFPCRVCVSGKVHGCKVSGKGSCYTNDWKRKIDLEAEKVPRDKKLKHCRLKKSKKIWKEKGNLNDLKRPREKILKHCGLKKNIIKKT